MSYHCDMVIMVYMISKALSMIIFNIMHIANDIIVYDIYDHQ